MRKFAFLLLLATTATPALADPDSDDRRSERKAERQEREKPRAERRQQREERQESRAERPERRPDVSRERPSRTRSVDAPARPNRSLETGGELRERRFSGGRPERTETVRSPSAAGGGGGGELRERRFSDRRPERTETVTAPSAGGGGGGDRIRLIGDTVRERRAGERDRDQGETSIERRNLRRPPLRGGSGRQLVEPERPVPHVLDPDRRRRVSRTPLPGTEPPPPRTASTDVAEPRHRWRDDWRRDHRYDWRDHRKRHRSLFHIGFYFDPFGWNYHRYGVGWRLWPIYYSHRYWLNDPWQYRLPPAYGPYRWIRYHDDALLVNVYTGQVVDVIYDFFW